MSYYEQPASAPFYADGLTKNDAKALKSFLAKVTTDMAQQYSVGTDTHRAARALDIAVGAQIDDLNLYFDDDEPETLASRMRAWNRLVFSIWPWEGAEGFDAHRWRLVERRNLEDALRHARYTVNCLEKLATKRKEEHL